jgi:hypothetical protein
MKIKPKLKKEYFTFNKPYEEPNLNLYSEEYTIERFENENEIVWFGYKTNWKKEPNKNWQKLDSIGWSDCNIPIYEKLYQAYKRNYKINRLFGI